VRAISGRRLRASVGLALALATMVSSVPAHASSVGGPVEGTPPLVYPANSGNPVQHHPRIYLIFWGPNWTATDQIVTSSQALLQYLAGSTYNAILTQYYSESSSVRTYIGNDAQLAGYALDSSNTPTTVNDATVTNEIVAVSGAKGWQNSGDTQYAVFPQSGAS